MNNKRVVVIGPESTGKSTLSASLAQVFGTLWVPEYARQYLEKLNRLYTEDDLLQIAKGQIAHEDKLYQEANNLLICDTDLHVVKVWSEHKYGHCHKWIKEQIALRKYDLYLLTGIDIPWQDDPLREHPDEQMRLYFYTIYKQLVINCGVPWAAINGNEYERLHAAQQAIQSLVS